MTTTITNAFDNAKFKDSLVFGVVEQGYACEYFDPKQWHFSRQIRYLRFDPEFARGVCWARNMAMSLWSGEEYYMQVDSHTLFDPDWDEKLLTYMEDLRSWHSKPIITAYPHPFLAENNDINNLKRTKLSGCLTLIADEEHGFIGDSDMYVGTKCHIIDSSDPVHGYMISGNCFFTLGQVCEDVPYDPYLYFSGEEHSWALRLWTDGYNIFHVPEIPLYHHYGRDYRTTAWGDQYIESRRHMKWYEHDVLSKERLRKLVTGQLSGRYSLGNHRSLEDYIRWTGINYHTRMLDQRSKTGEQIFPVDYRKPIALK